MTKQDKAKLAAIAATATPFAIDARVLIAAKLQIKNNPDAYVADAKNIDFTGFDWNAAGIESVKGDKGDKGDTGEQGPAGPTGPKGDTGDRGSFTFTANVNVGSDTDVNVTDLVIPDGMTPKVNDLILDINGDLYLITAVADGTVHVGEALAVNLKGPAGEKGDKGDTGAAGAAGEKGDKGDTGDAGPQGPAGAKGDKGDPFSIAKTFASVDEMNKGYATDGVAVGNFVMIDTGNVNDEDNAKLYVKGEKAYTFITDLSGATGLTGPQGEQGPQGIQGPKGDAGPQGEAGAAGEKGDKGDAGAAGPAGPKGDKGDAGARGSFTFTANIDVESGGTVDLTALTIPEGITPQVNDYVLDTHGDLYLITAVGDDNVTVGNALPVNLKGPQGEQAAMDFVSEDFIRGLFA